MVNGSNLKEAPVHSLKTDFGTSTRILMWNVKGLREKIEGINEYLTKFDIVCLSETWIEEKGYAAAIKKLPKDFQWQWIPAVRIKERGRAAGGIVIGTRKSVKVKNFQGNMRGCWASVEANIDGERYIIIYIYNNSSLEIMNKELSELMESTMDKGCVLLGGDLNARIGKLGGWEEGHSRQTKDVTVNRDGEKWNQFFDTYGLQILNGNMAGDSEGEFTRLGYTHQEEAVLDYACGNAELIGITELFKVGTRIQSDHFPLEMSTTSKCSRAEEKREIQIWNERTKAEYREKMSKHPMAKESDSLYDRMRQCTTKKVTSTHEVKNPWWSNECYLKRRAMTDELHLLRAGKGDTNKYRALKKEYKNTCKKSKETYKEKCRSELETVKSIQDGWKFISKYRKMRRPAPLTYPPDLVLFEHFKNLLQGPKIDDEPSNIIYSPEEPDLRKEEFDFAISKLKERKATGPDGLKAEAIMYADVNSKEQLQETMAGIMKGNEMPREWGMAQILPIYKKGDPLLPSNYRGIAIGSPCYKLLATLVNERLVAHVEEMGILPDTQNGFRKGRSVMDNVYILHQCIQKSLSKKAGKLYTFFIDFKTAFDSVNRTKLFQTLNRMNIPRSLIGVIARMYKNTGYMIGEKSFQSYRGLKQGCPLSPILFALYITGLEKALQGNQSGGVLLNTTRIHCLGFADDFVMMADTAPELTDMVQRIQRYATNRELIINAEKSKVLTFNKGSRRTKKCWTIGGAKYEEVSTFVYLGVHFQSNGEFTRHIEAMAEKSNRRETEA